MQYLSYIAGAILSYLYDPPMSVLESSIPPLLFFGELHKMWSGTLNISPQINAQVPGGSM